MCVLIALAVCNGPLLYDYTLIYKGSLDGTVLACVIGTILHLFLWIVVWLFLTVKQQWTFKLRVTVGHYMVRFFSRFLLYLKNSKKFEKFEEI